MVWKVVSMSSHSATTKLASTPVRSKPTISDTVYRPAT
jgi:hypothetical protein